MLAGIHGHQDIERVVYGKPAGPALLAGAVLLACTLPLWWSANRALER